MLGWTSIVFIVCHIVLSSQPINGETSVLSLESIPHDLSHIQCLWGNNNVCGGDILFNVCEVG